MRQEGYLQQGDKKSAIIRERLFIRDPLYLDIRLEYRNTTWKVKQRDRFPYSIGPP